MRTAAWNPIFPSTNGNVRAFADSLPLAQAVAIRGDRIVPVDRNDELAAGRSEATQTRDLQGKRQYPASSKDTGTLPLDSRHPASFSNIVTMVAESARATPAGGGEESLRQGIAWFQDFGTRFVQVDLLLRMTGAGTVQVRLWTALENRAADMEDPLADYRMVGYGNSSVDVRSAREIAF